VIIGDNLSSHFCHDVISACQKFGIRFVCLPPNSTQLCQPLDVSVFAPTKKLWRKILTEWKMNEGRSLPTLTKEWFPILLGRLLNAQEPTAAKNIQSGFRKCGIVPLDKTPVLRRCHHTPEETAQFSMNSQTAIAHVITEKLSEIRQQLLQSQTTTKPRKKRLNVVPGKSIALADLNQLPDSAAGPSSSVSFNEHTDNQGSVSEDSSEEDVNVSQSDDEDFPILPIFPVPDQRLRSHQSRYSQRMRKPVVRKDYI
jgi:hypothetical protein